MAGWRPIGRSHLANLGIAVLTLIGVGVVFGLDPPGGATPPATPDRARVGPLAFPGAVGYGAYAVGGRGGRVIYVSTLEDSGPGSLREAVNASGPRTVLFNVAGTITLTSPITVSEPYLTIAAQTAPGEGIQVRGDMLRIRTHDIVIRYLRVRTGDAWTSNPADADAISLNGRSWGEVHDVIIDHSTLIWGPDVGGVTIINGVDDVTVQRSIIGEGLRLSRHPEGSAATGGHSYGTNITSLRPDAPHPRRITYYLNLIANSDSRNPRVIGAECVDVVNNVIFNWGTRIGYGNPRSLNLVANWLRPGPQSVTDVIWHPDTRSNIPGLTEAAVFEDANVGDGVVLRRGEPDRVFRASPACPPSVEPLDPVGAHEQVLSDAGATNPVRDLVDSRIVADVRTGAGGGFLNGADQPPPNVAWPELKGTVRAPDSDGDGMPDAWEDDRFGTPHRDGRGDADGDGFTDLEEFLNGSEP